MCCDLVFGSVFMCWDLVFESGFYCVLGFTCSVLFSLYIVIVCLYLQIGSGYYYVFGSGYNCVLGF